MIEQLAQCLVGWQNVPTLVGTNERSYMETFNIRDLRNRTGELVREAEHGRLSVVTKHGHPIFIAVPFDETLVKHGVMAALAVSLVAEQKVGLAQAARIAGVAPSEMMDILSELKVSLAGYSADELADEVEQHTG